jgi:hypothetical protein
LRASLSARFGPAASLVSISAFLFALRQADKRRRQPERADKLA